jgi:hypothetical protein
MFEMQAESPLESRRQHFPSDCACFSVSKVAYACLPGQSGSYPAPGRLAAEVGRDLVLSRHSEMGAATEPREERVSALAGDAPWRKFCNGSNTVAFGSRKTQRMIQRCHRIAL